MNLLSQIIPLQLLIMSEIALDCLIFSNAVLHGHEELATLEKRILNVLNFFTINQKTFFVCFF